MRRIGIDLAAGAVIARRYRLEHLLGEGGMGAVWAATHLITRRKLAMKFIRGPVHLKPDLRRRFLREARAASAVNHANVVQIHDVFELDDDTPVMVMDLLEGETLARRISRDRQLSIEETASLLLPVVSAVGTAHARGIVHRDLKPENVFLERTEDGEQLVKVLDFGIAKLTFGADPDEGVVTGTGTALGTPCYMAPEQCFGEKDVDHGADTWAIGVMLYELLAGCRPIEGDAVGQIVKSMMTSSITPLEVLAPKVPGDVAALVRSMLSRDREKRPQDLREVHEVLARHCDLKVRAFGAPSSLAPSTLASAPTVEDDRIEIVAPAVPQPETARPESEHTALSGELTRGTTTGAHSVSAPSPPPRRRLLIGGAAILAAAVAATLLARSLSRPPAEASTASAATAPSNPPATPTRAVERPADPTPAPVAAPSPAAPESPIPSATRPSRAGSKPVPAAVRRPAPGPSSTAAPRNTTGLFDDRK